MVRLIKSINLGLNEIDISCDVNSRGPRRIIPADDIYPPIITKQNSVKVHDFDRLVWAILYLQCDRVKELINEYLVFDPNKLYKKSQLYGQNILHVICGSNMPTNLYYSNNYKLYDQIFFSLIKLIPDGVNKFHFRDSFGRTPVHNAIRYKKYHYFFAMLNHGLKLTQKDIHDICHDTEFHNDKLKSFIKSKRLQIVMNSSKKPGFKLLELIEFTDDQLIISEDGDIYNFNDPYNPKLKGQFVYLFLEDAFVLL